MGYALSKMVVEWGFFIGFAINNRDFSRTCDVRHVGVEHL